MFAVALLGPSDRLFERGESHSRARGHAHPRNGHPRGDRRDTDARLVRQLITESVLLSLAGGGVGVLLSLWFSDRLKGFYPTLDFDTVDMDAPGRASIRACSGCLRPWHRWLAAVIFGVARALRASKVDQASAMKNRRRNDVGVGRVPHRIWKSSSDGPGDAVLRAAGGGWTVPAQHAICKANGGSRLRSHRHHHVRRQSPVARPTMRRAPANFTSGWWIACAPFRASIRRRWLSGFHWMPTTCQLLCRCFPEGYVPGLQSREPIQRASRAVGPHYFETIGTRLVAWTRGR